MTGSTRGQAGIGSLAVLGGLLALGLPLAHGAAAFSEAEVLDFTDRHCSSCHNDVDKEGGLDLTNLTFNSEDPNNFLLG